MKIQYESNFWGDFLTKVKNFFSKKVKSTPEISQKAFDLIIYYEVGGGKGFYNKALKKPIYPGGFSGITIGIGYDLGHNDLSNFTADWKGKISDSDFNCLKKVLGFKGQNAKLHLFLVSKVSIPWETAIEVFKKNTIPKFIQQTLKAFPGADELHPDAFGALVSLVFNRGSSLSGEKRIEMKNIRNLIKNKDYKGIANEIRKMKRLWVGKGLNGLLKRRDEEADLVESCI